MSEKDEIKELDKMIKKIDPNLSIWLMTKFIIKFKDDFETLISQKINNRDIFDETLNTIESCEKIQDVMGKITVLFSKLKIDVESKKIYLNELIHEYPESKLIRILKIINNDKRLSDYLYYHLDYKYHKINQKKSISYINNLLIAPELENKKSNKDTLFHSNELTYFYSNNTPLLINLYLTNMYFKKINYENFFNINFKELINIKNKSKSIIERNLKNEEFTEWLFNYIEKNIIRGEMTQNVDYTPYTPKERTNLMLHQLDLWYLLDEKRYDQALKKIQSAWHKKTHDARKRASKL